MSFEQPNQTEDSESIALNRERLRESLGVTLCTKQKEGENVPLELQVGIAMELSLPSVQFDLRNRTSEEIGESLDTLMSYRESHPDVAISIHGETPKINEEDLSISNKGRIIDELNLVNALSGESYTVHPPSVNLKLFKELPEETKEKVVSNYCATFCETLAEAIKKDSRFNVAIENMPAKGDSGAYGQTIEDITHLIKKVEQTLVDQYGIDLEAARRRVGATLDVNHALHGADSTDYEPILRDWFEKLGDYIKVVHLYTPSEQSKEFLEKHKIVLELASRFSPNAKLFMESKQDQETTVELFNEAKSIE